MPTIEEMLAEYVDPLRAEEEERQALERHYRTYTRQELWQVVEGASAVPSLNYALAVREREIRADLYERFLVKRIEGGTVRYSPKKECWYYLDPPKGQVRDTVYKEC